MASTIVFLITFAMIFLAIGTAFGISSGITPNIQNTMNQITGPWPTVTTGNCSFSSDGPTGNCSILDTAMLGLIFTVSAFGSFLFRMGAGLVLIVQIAGIFTPLVNIPFVGPIFFVFVIIFGIYAYSHIRANHPELG